MGEMDKRAGEKRDVSLARAVLYRFLARCFSYPDMELLKLFDGDSLAQCLDGWRVLGLGASEEMAEVTGWLEAAGLEAASQELQIEYTRLFVNAYPRIPAPPYSSVYLDGDGLVWGKSTAQAARFYEAAGLYPAGDFLDIPDHIAAELEFVSYLITEQLGDEGNSSPGAQELASIEQEFLTEHLFGWATVFFGRVAERSGLVFYRVIAELARKFVEWEVQRSAQVRPKPFQE